MKLIKQKDFIDLYNKGKNDSEIGRLLNVSHVTVKNFRENLILPSNFKYVRKFDKNKFKDLYNQKLNDVEIANILNVSSSAISEFRRLNKLPSNQYVYEEKRLDFAQEQVLLGGILGDAHLIKHKNVSGQFLQSLKQEKYLKYKWEFLKDFATDIQYSYQIDKRTQKKYEKVFFMLKTHPVFNPYYDLFYKNKIKVINKEMLYRLEGLGLAVWFMDDGCKHVKTYRLATNCFKLEELFIIKEFFKNKFNIDVSIHSKKVVYIKTHSAHTFKKLIEPYIIESMKYKLHCPL